MTPKVNAIVCLSVMVSLFVGCASRPDAPRYKSYGMPRKVAPFLYEIHYDDYTPNPTVELAGGTIASGCSAVRNGNFYGRNLDFYYNNMPQFVVHIAAKPGRYASLAVCGCPDFSDQELFACSTETFFMERIPNFVYDGINEKGVACNVNVVPAKDTAPLTGTNPGAPRICSWALLRVILDQAASAREAIELLGRYDIVGTMGTYNFHYMICDKKDTFIVEIIDNKLVCIEQKIMVNFYHSLPKVTPHGSGVERYQILKENYAEGNTWDGMANLLKRVRYSRAYQLDTQPPWYSEFVGMKDAKSGVELTNDNKPADVLPVIQPMNARFVHRDRDSNDKAVWITVSNSTYDLEKRALRLVVQENYNDVFYFSLTE